MEALLVAVAFLLYFAVRGAVIDRPEVAYRHAVDIIDAQRRLGFFWEDNIQRWSEHKLVLVQAFNLIYFYLHFPLIIVFGIALYCTNRRKYTLMRDAFLASGALALLVYWLYPVAPPRELPALAARFDANAPSYITSFIDTMQVHLGYAYDTQSTRAFVNPYAAMPSLHFGWDLLLGIGLCWWAWGTRFKWIVVPIGIALPISQIFAITITGNHFFLDAMAGAAISLCGFPIAIAMGRYVYPWLSRRIMNLPWPLVRNFFLPNRELKPDVATKLP